MIKSISMKNCASYGADAAVLSDCRKINFIYGPNGSGKSTLSNYLSDPADPMYANCAIEYDSADRPEIVVYNRRFKDRNFSGSSEIKGVFTLGEATIADIEKLNGLKADLERCQSEHNAAAAACEQAKARGPAALRDFRETIWNLILLGDGKAFSEAFTGLRRSKDRFAAEVLVQYQRYRKQKPALCDPEDLRARRNSLFQNTPEACQPFTLPDASTLVLIHRVEADEIFQRVIVGNQDIPIGRLIRSLNNSDWVNHGRQHLTGSDICPFCQRPTITADFRRQLEEFFGGEYETALQTLRSLKNYYAGFIRELLASLEALAADAQKCAIGQLDREAFSQKRRLLAAAFLANSDAIDDKLSEPSRVITLSDTAPMIREIMDLLRTANDAIDAHNAMVKDIKKQRERFSEDVWNYCLHQHDAVISGHLEDMKQIEKDVKDCVNEKSRTGSNLKRLEEQIADAEKKMTSVQPAVDAINRTLHSYGFNNFLITPSPTNPNMYQIQRPDGTLANDTLSEGEETFITFLYYLQLINGSVTTSGVTGRKILVIDDPICSLDSTVLYVVSAMVNALLWQAHDAKYSIDQVFILTHNVYFHKEASDEKSLPGKKTNLRFWIIRKRENISSFSDHGHTNPIHTSYEMLWKELRDDDHLPIVSMQNIMRRIIENYFSMLGGNPRRFLPDKFETTEEKIIARSLFQWINDGSHSIPDDLYYSTSPDAPEKYKEVFRRIFEVTHHEAHYNMMMGLEP